ncbi:NAD(P)/FAD-dependent oxidoreductase [Aminipila butyrica]|uniref:NAD(P)/FAD-dependent oxidoreductase n=1 Tax=Aminipila butyrica TaxID=433296 RepID=A0A858BXN0_9FIRM|nr:NAD(P)/FAD-dependent oxidoreductase [Aminipila butyrica]QIB69660.1 NAD(P)/FAD-dependent oxidoreductase [Aminipila butyrica]
MEDNNTYDVIIIGAGAAGLFCAASYEVPVRGLILEKSPSAGRKLLMSGSGQCNLTHGGDIKDFVNHYGDKGGKIRSVLYKFNNQALRDFFESRGLPLAEREDGKVFPRSLSAKDVLKLLLDCGSQKGFQLACQQKVCRIEPVDGGYTVFCEDEASNIQRRYCCRKLVVAAGGCSYPTTGSDGSIFPLLAQLGLEIVPPKPALVPIFVQDYPYGDLSGTSFTQAVVKIGGKEIQGGLLLTHTGFSGPSILNLSRYTKTGGTLQINYFPGKSTEEIISGLKKNVPKSSKQAAHFLLEYVGTAGSKRFAETICQRAGVPCTAKASSLSGSQLKKLGELLSRDTFSISGTGGFNTAMATAGGGALTEIQLKNMECRKYPGLFLIGEVLDVDGDTGGYNLQFAWSSAYAAGRKSS